MLEEGSVLADKYTVVGQVGNALLAKNYDEGIHVLIKELPVDEGDLLAVQDQVSKASRFSFDGFLPVLDIVEDDGKAYLVSHYEAEETAADRVANSPLEVEEALNSLLPLVESLEQAWKTEEMAHGAISPQSILIDEDFQPYLLSFSASSSKYPLYAGFNDESSLAFVAPELKEGETSSNKSDMFSLGAVLYFLVTGEVVEAGSKLEGDFPEPFIQLINDLLETEASYRPHSWQTVITQATKVFDVLHGAPEEISQGSGIEIQEQSEDLIEPGTIVGNGFEVDAKIAEGSMGDIYTAYREEDDLFVQVKVLPAHLTDDVERFQRFLREIKLTASLKHPNLLSVVEYGNEFNGRHYIVTEYEKSITLESYIGRYAPLPEKEAISLVKQIGDVLAYAWDGKKVLHRDIKPKNILVNEQSKQAKLTDFGIAKSMDSEDNANLTGVGYTVGTPEYMSPEQVRAEEDLDFRSDLYALGLVLYEALTGQKAFGDKNPMVVMQKQLNEQPVSIKSLNPKVSSSAVALCEKMLAKDRDDRFASWSRLFDMMDAVELGGNTTSSGSLEPVSPEVAMSSVVTEEEPKRAPVVPIIIGVVVLLAVIAGVVLKGN